mmetsp:Transcript_31354/g.44513  ORF Transcript_31354/g.44513 Transcript_31354/m.44513 type:complete len:221 (+) Transcript_31354:150-812(+)
MAIKKSLLKAMIVEIFVFGSVCAVGFSLLISAAEGLIVNPTVAINALKARGSSEASSSRLNLAAASYGTASSSSSYANLSPRQLIAEGMKAFRDGNIDDSIDFFNRADRAVPDGSLRPYLWQRGISFYYADLFRQGSDQFRFDVRVNPLDVEEIVWDIACLSRMNADTLPPPNMMALPKGKKDRRKIMVRNNSNVTVIPTDVTVTFLLYFLLYWLTRYIL